MRNAAAFTEAFGVQNAPLVVWMSMVPWEDEDRDFVIDTLTGRGANGDSQRRP